MVILGIDPGTIVTGYGVIEISGGSVKLVASGMIKNRAGTPMADRLKSIHDTLRKVITDCRPDEVALETAFCGKNAQSALKLGQARGVAILSAVSHDIPVAEYSPREVKKAVVGNGNASKQQVEFMVRNVLRMKDRPGKFDITDALAVALCHTHGRRGEHRRYRDWNAYVKQNPGKTGGKGGAE